MGGDTATHLGPPLALDPKPEAKQGLGEHLVSINVIFITILNFKKFKREKGNWTCSPRHFLRKK